MLKTVKRSFISIILITIALYLNSCKGIENDSDKIIKMEATVIEIEKYGHAVLNVTTSELEAKGFALGDIVNVRLGSCNSNMPFFDGYYSNSRSLMLRGTTSKDYIAVCINYGNFSDVYNIKVGDIAEITMVEKEGMLDIQELYALQYSNNREDFIDDATFANFRAVTVGRIGEGKLFRSSSPINNKKGRAVFANNLIKSIGVTTILNLSDSIKDVEECFKNNDVDTTYYRSLYEDGYVLAIDLTGNFYSDEFTSSLVKGLTFLSKNETPYCIHCTEGKDRTGFTAMLLGALMGATLDEIINDYMISYYNYYGIDKEQEPKRYQAVLDVNLMEMLLHVTGAESVEELIQIDLESAVTVYLINAGMELEDINILKEKLG